MRTHVPVIKYTVETRNVCSRSPGFVKLLWVCWIDRETTKVCRIPVEAGICLSSGYRDPVIQAAVLAIPASTTITYIGCYRTGRERSRYMQCVRGFIHSAHITDTGSIQGPEIELTFTECWIQKRKGGWQRRIPGSDPGIDCDLK